ncbi:EAL domain-containing protein [Rhodoferax saidenbachensis]|uniref:EAL domain-containing protein (Putative c-di-GMP-specific phosphodiesterase class I) n=1 Tax=Rhodoferax saidenbachensis TaxID=1484693 RepID=A0ABU1ZSX3_9BURK|nr:EAL domain-containing protein [Rhodoferax saidenbachensis]MDR7308640.1 EAL domain-containing protein (putative c-di-GMP-specific phosphodiesterase class I) [Rhodoferax saidenbachensis]
MSAMPLFHRLLQRWPAKNPPHPLQVLLDQGKLGTLYQPIIALQTGEIDGHEALARGHSGTELPPVLLDSAQAIQLQTELELASAGLALQGWGYPHTQGRMYLSFSAATLATLSETEALSRLHELFQASGVPCKRIVVEVTNHRKIDDLAALARATTALQAQGCAIALDDIKASQRSLNLWMQLKPSIVKMDGRMTTDLQNDPAKAKVLRSLAAFGFKTGASLVAKAVEDADNLRIVRDSGVQLAQGRFLGFPSPSVVETLNLRARQVLTEKWAPHDPASQPAELIATDTGPQGLQWFD